MKYLGYYRFPTIHKNIKNVFDGDGGSALTVTVVLQLQSFDDQTAVPTFLRFDGRTAEPIFD